MRKLNDLELRWLVIPLILPCCAAVLTLPFARLAFSDDWAYMHMALRYSQAGAIQYNGWNEPLAIVQAIYGGLLIRLFGFSFNLLRFATVPIAAGCSALIYLLCRRTELPPSVSLFASLTATLSPLFIPLAASFMTDAYGCFFFLLCLLLGVHAIGSVRAPSASMWLLASVITGLIGGADRQNCWVAPFAVLACFAWRKRKLPLLLFFTALLAIISIGSIVELLHWYARQPNAAVILPAWQNIRDARELPRFAMQYCLSAILFCLPSLLLLFPPFSRLSPMRWCLALAGALIWTAVGLGHPTLLAPWLVNNVTVYGVLRPKEDLLGDKPVVLGIISRAVLTAIVLFVGCVLVQSAIPRLSSFFGRNRKDAPFSETAAMVRSAVTLLAVSLLGCLVLVALRGLMGFVWDDYLLPWLPLFLILLARMLWRRGLEPKWPFAWAALAIFAAYGIAATHNYYAAARARIQAAEKLEAASVSRRHIDGGLEFNAWTQLMAAGYICDPDARPPSGGLGCSREPDNAVPGQWFRGVTPVVDPQYYLSFSSVPTLVSSRFAPVSYRAWLPPFRRQVFILTRESR